MKLGNLEFMKKTCGLMILFGLCLLSYGFSYPILFQYLFNPTSETCIAQSNKLTEQTEQALEEDSECAGIDSSANKSMMNIQIDPNISPQILVEDVFVKSGCFDVENVSFDGNLSAIGYFSSGLTAIGIEDGIIISSGNVNSAAGPNNSNSTSGTTSFNNSDNDLEDIANAPNDSFDAAILEFSFTPAVDSVSFQFAFASEEYPEFVNANVNDAFGFFVSGPGINGPFENNAVNVALIPGTNTFITIDDVNANTNNTYYNSNGGGNFLEYDAYLDVITASIEVIPCEQYNIKLAICDIGDDIYDSAVFLAGDSFNAGQGVTVNAETSTGQADEDVVEGCNGGVFFFQRENPNDLSEEVVVTFEIGGTAENGVDYDFIADSIVIPAGIEKIELLINPILDALTEGAEEIIITITSNLCSCANPTITLTIVDNVVSCDDNNCATIDAYDADNCICLFELDPTVNTNCDDGDCSNGVETFDDVNCICIPGQAPDCATGLTIEMPCDDGNPATLNDQMTVLDCNGEVCIPCQGIIQNVPTCEEPNFILNGTATEMQNFMGNEGCIQLTNTGQTQTACAWYPCQLDFSEPFTLNFQVFLGNSDGGADGMTLTFQANDVAVCGTDGQGLAVDGIPNSLILEFDTYQNSTIGDPFGDHLALTINGNVDHTIPGNSIQAPIVVDNLEDNDLHEVVFSWNPENMKYDISLDGNLIFSDQYDFIGNVFAGNTLAYYGFTASTGALSNNQIVCPDVLSSGTSQQSCSDGDDCTFDDFEVVLNCTGEICEPCAGTPYDCSNGPTTMQACNDGNDCTINDMEAVDCSGNICVPCAGEIIDCTTGPNTMQACNDGDDCTINDMEAVDCAGNICVPCAGEIIDCSNGATMIVSCDDGNPNTLDDQQSVLLCDGSPCGPCQGTAADCQTGTTSIEPCDDGNDCTINDEQTVLNSNGEICEPCIGVPVDCNTGPTSTVACNDGDDCTINDMQTIDCFGNVCSACLGETTDCGTGPTSIVACNDGDDCTINDVQTVDCNGEICVPCLGEIQDCTTGPTSIVACNDGDDCTINDVQTVDCNGEICIPCQGEIQDCTTGPTNIVACNDGDNCTINDVQTVDCNGEICVPCLGEITDCTNGITSTEICDDGNDCTINDELVVDCNGIVCVPCLGEIIDCSNGATQFVPCDDLDSNTIDDQQSVLVCDGSPCGPCQGTPTDCDTGNTTVVDCDDGNDCTINDEQTILDSNGVICEPCIGQLIDCNSGQTITVPCNDNNPCTINDVQTELDCNGEICLPCLGETTDCGNGTTSVVPCDDGDIETINDVQTILDCNGTICVPCLGEPTFVPSCDDPDYILNGSASLIDFMGQENCIQLTSPTGNLTACAWYPCPLNFSENFTLNFDLYLGDNNDGADGITLTFQANDVAVCGGEGESLGIDGIPNSVILEFDTYQNSNQGDPSQDHVAIGINGNINHNNTSNIIEAPVEVGNLENDVLHNASFSWDPMTNNYTFALDGDEIYNNNFDFINLVFGGNPNAFYGFTASTGLFFNNQVVCIDISSASASLLPCDDSNPCTINDMELVLDCTGEICEPCMGELIDCSNGPTLLENCDDMNPSTINDVQLVLACNGSICEPCAGIPGGCGVGSSTVFPCDDGDICTINDEETILDSDGTVCIPCGGEALDCDTGPTNFANCDDNNDCTQNDLQELDCYGNICGPCIGLAIDCSNSQTIIQSCDDNNSNTANDEETVLACDGSICIPCQGIPVECINGTTITINCDDGDPCTINDMELV